MEEKMKEKINLIDEKIKELTAIKALMSNGLNICRDCCMPFEDDINCKIIIGDITLH